jgi:hypothetical protein
MIATKSLDISYPVEEYRRIVEDDTEVYSKDHMATKIVHTRRFVAHNATSVHANRKEAMICRTIFLRRARCDRRRPPETKRRTRGKRPMATRAPNVNLPRRASKCVICDLRRTLAYFERRERRLWIYILTWC